MKKLDGSSTKYTRLIAALLAAFALACASPALAQDYASSTVSVSTYPATSDDDAQGTLLTIHKESGRGQRSFHCHR
jgi:hypothetical protein